MLHLSTMPDDVQAVAAQLHHAGEHAGGAGTSSPR
jgi:hypothetical protein